MTNVAARLTIELKTKFKVLVERVTRAVSARDEWK